MNALILLALGYLVDFFDLTLFAAARASILESLHVAPENVMNVSRLMFNSQAIGIAIGGVCSGMWGDKIGRMSSVRIGIFIYSIAILWSTVTTSVDWFICLRFLAGFGLAGELGSSVTFVTEAYEGKKRDRATSIIYFSGVLGGILATVLSAFVYWKTLFIIGACAGFVLLFLRMNIKDSVLFHTLKEKSHIKRGSLKELLFKRTTLTQVVALTSLLVPFWFMVYFINFGPEVAKQIGVNGKPLQSIILGCFFIGSVFGTYTLAYLAPIVKSRKKLLISVFVWMFCVVSILLLGNYMSLYAFYGVMFLLGMGCGYPGLYTTLAAETFGTNLRTTGTCMVSCLGRASLVVINSLVPFLIAYTASVSLGIVISNLIVLGIVIIALSVLQETHQRSIDFLS